MNLFSNATRVNESVYLLQFVSFPVHPDERHGIFDFQLNDKIRNRSPIIPDCLKSFRNVQFFMTAGMFLYG